MPSINKHVTLWLRFTLIAVSVGSIVALTALGASIYLRHRSAMKSSSCDTKGIMHYVTIKENAVTPVTTSATICEQLTIQNNDNAERLLSFGQHDHHISYDGHTSEILKSGQSVTITLTQTGSFRFHDHYNDNVHGVFTVVAR